MEQTESPPPSQATSETTTVSKAITTGPKTGFDRVATQAGYVWTLLYLITGGFVTLVLLSPTTAIDVAKMLISGALASYWTLLSNKEKV
jgi:hypothetical protein